MDVGVHCSMKACQRLDFLPFTCDLCHRVFCKAHSSAASHNCGNVHQPHSLEVVEGAKEKGDVHVCSVAECGRREHLEITCPLCGRSLCLAHRHPEDHACPSLLPSPSARATAATQSSQPHLTSSKKAGGGARGGAKSDLLTAKVALMKLKQRADGPHSIPESERVYYSVTLPAGCRGESAPLFFSKEWAVGKVVDIISQKFKISNHNDKSHAKKLMLFGRDGTPLQSSQPLYTYLEILPSGSSVTVDYAP